ncbi:hypothetical protein [Pedobacter caeni]|uniref:ABC-2 type transport system permease protein n=1 Tax=Pedobacter caeni TaxID=288992 RepID=A0A1M5EZP9_9SPHI|nr:hypothetical protein [Pedobacter caeni]SHF84482.1 hypothetical protein SAMN04488522_103866 [Pedobacter caeni]
MTAPLTHLLIKTFSRGFFRLHSGMLLFLFVAVFSYCFFILTAGTITPENALVFNIIFLLSFASAPVMMILVFIVWLIYTIKSWQYVAAQLQMDQYQFLYYSSTALSKAKQFKSWFVAQLFISIPLIVYGLFSVIAGAIYGHYVIPVLIVIYLLLLNGISAFLYLHLMNRIMRNEESTLLNKLTNSWKKPYQILFLYHIIHRKKLAYLITKTLCWGILSGVLLLFSDVKNDLRIAGMAILGVAIAHTFLIYQGQRFEVQYLSFSKNFPYSRNQLYGQLLLFYVLLLLPEGFWLLIRFDPGTASGLFLLMLSVTLLFRSLLYRIGLHMNSYLPWVFGLFFLFFWMIMFQWIWFLIPINLLLSYLLFYRNYYR